MKYFIMTAGSALNLDYRWWQAGENGVLYEPKPDDFPTIQGKRLDQLNDWLGGDPSYVSVLLGQINSPGQTDQDKKWLLLITELPTTRKDYQGRIIRNSLAFVQENGESLNPDQDTICLLASLALREAPLLNRVFDEFICEDYSKEQRFQFDLLKFDRFIEEKIKLIKNNKETAQENQPIKWDKSIFRIAAYSGQTCQEICDYLLSRDAISGRDLHECPILFISTNFKNPSFYCEQPDQFSTVLVGWIDDNCIKKFRLIEKEGWYVLDKSKFNILHKFSWRPSLIWPFRN